MFFAARVIRTVERIEFPSTKHLITAARRCVDSLFILTSIPERSSFVKHFPRKIRKHLDRVLAVC